MSGPIAKDVTDTALLVAHHRAVETARPRPLFRDPLAARLAGDDGRRIAEAMPTVAMTGWVVAMRTLVIDRYVAEAIARGVDTVVNLGAGMDTRPYRMDLPASLRWIEADHARIVDLKEERLAGEVPRCRVERVRVDLADDAARRAFLAGIGGRKLVLTEGVVVYLDEDAAGALADDLRALPDVDGWIVDRVSPEAAAHRRRAGADEALRNAPFRFSPPDWTAFFAAHGWRPRETRYLADEGDRVGRAPPLPLPVRLLLAASRRFAPAGKRDGFRASMGYVLLEPAPPHAPTGSTP